MYNHNKAQQSKNRVHISWDILYEFSIYFTSVFFRLAGGFQKIKCKFTQSTVELTWIFYIPVLIILLLSIFVGFFIYCNGIKITECDINNISTFQLHTYYRMNWSRSVFDQTMGCGSRKAPMVQAHSSILLKTGRGISTLTYILDNVFNPDKLSFGSDIEG